MGESAKRFFDFSRRRAAFVSCGIAGDPQWIKLQQTPAKRRCPLCGYM
jgi:hypothetical protein